MYWISSHLANIQIWILSFTDTEQSVCGCVGVEDVIKTPADQ